MKGSRKLPKTNEQERVNVTTKGRSDEERARVVEINNAIAKHASRKDANAALELFGQLKADGLQNTHSYAAIVNALIRCGNIKSARELFDEFKDSKRFKMDVVMCTTLLKGYCADCDMKSCLEIMNIMDNSKPKVLPNIRTINTFLRGCVITGQVEHADAIMKKMKPEYNLSPDVSTMEYVASLLCQGLRKDKVYPMIGRIKDSVDMRTGMSAIHLAEARMDMLLGDWVQMRKALNNATAGLQYIITTNIGDKEAAAAEIVDVSSSKMDEPQKTKTTLGGKRAWKESRGSINDSREQSLQVYQEHKRSELQLEITGLETYLQQRQSLPLKTHLTNMISFLVRLWSLVDIPEAPIDGDECKIEWKKAMVDVLLSHLTVNFGLEGISEKLMKLNSQASNAQNVPELMEKSGKSANSGLKSANNKIANDTKELLLRPVASWLSNCVDHQSGHISVDRLFQPFDFIAASCVVPSGCGGSDPLEESIPIPKLAHDDKGDKNVSSDSFVVVPVKVEICSGSGEWCVAQASNDVTSQWVAMEVRHDRLYQSFTRAVQQNVTNLAFFGGNAMHILQRYIAPNSLEVICVNHPEPPQQSGGQSSQGKHLLTTEAFNEFERVLKPKGMVTVVTDNLWYAKFLLRQLAARQQPQKGHAKRQKLWSLSPALVNHLGLEGKWDVVDYDSNVFLFSGRPGKECGHVVQASSYFDRLWKRENMLERYFIVLRKCKMPKYEDESSVELRVTDNYVPPAPFTGDVNNNTPFVGVKRSSGIAEQEFQNKKIKFED